MHRLKSITKFIFRFLLLLAMLLLGLALILQIPAVQQSLTGKLETFLQNKFQTAVNVQSIQLKLPESLALKGVFVEDQNEDTLLNLGDLTVNFKLNKLLSKQIQFDKISLSDGKANLQIGQDSSNFDFILNAFSQEQETSPVETFAPEPNTKSDKPGWQMTFNDAGLTLQNIDFQFSDTKGGISLNTHLGSLYGKVKEVDYILHHYDVERLHINDSKVFLKLTDVKGSETSPLPDTSVYKIIADDILIEKTLFELKMPELEIETTLGKVAQKKGIFKMKPESLLISSQSFQIKESELQYDVPSAVYVDGFDPNHFDLEEINIELSDFDYESLKIEANIVNLSAREKKGFELKNLQSQFNFSEEELLLNELVLNTYQSDIKSTKTLIQYPFLSTDSVSFKQLFINSDLKVNTKNLSDIRYFYPELDSIAFFQKASDSPLIVHSTLYGSLADLSLSSLNFEGFNSKLITSGNIKNLTELEKLNLDIDLFQFETEGAQITAALPQATLPDFVQLPKTINIIGSLKGDLQNFNSTINATTFRDSSIVPAQIKAAINLQNISNLDSTYVDIQLDTILTSKTNLMAYLPKDVLPDYVDLPNELLLKGEVKGKVSKLESNLQLLTSPNENASQINVFGGISGLFVSDNPQFDIHLDAKKISTQDIEGFLPDSLLPSYFQLPLIKKIAGVFKGGLDNFKTDFQIESNAGHWSGNASLKKKSFLLDLEVETLTPESFFTEAYLDSLVGFAFQPLSLELELNGRRFDFSESSFADLFLTIKKSADDSMEGLKIEGKLEKQRITAKATADEKEIHLTSDFYLDYSNPIPQWGFDLLLNHLDLEKLNLTAAPASITGKMETSAEGMNLDTLSAQMLFSNLAFQYADNQEQIDSLLIHTKLDNGENTLTISSDLLNADLTGQFKYPGILALSEQWFHSFLDPNAPDSLIGATNDHFEFSFSLHRPEILTMGFIPNLDKLSPFRMSGNLDNRIANWGLNTTIPFVSYQDMGFENLTIEGKTQNKVLDYQIGFQEANIQNIAQVQNFSTFGDFENQMLSNTIQIQDEQQAKRFELKSFLEIFNEQEFRFTFSSEQLLNYQNWLVSEQNEIHWSDDKIAIKDWRFYRNTESIIIKDLGQEKLEFQFENFDLTLLSDIVKLNSHYLGGILNGNVLAAKLLTEPTFSAELDIDSLMVLNAALGNLNLDAEQNANQTILATASLFGNGNEVIIGGQYDLEGQFEQLDFKVDIPQLNLPSIEPWVAEYLENTEGKLTGNLQVEGSLESPTFLGQIQFENTAFDIELLKTRLRLGNQPIVFDANVIEFKDLDVFDANNNKGVLSSYLITDDYRDFLLQSNVAVSDFLILNTSSKDNDLYYGKLLVDATVNLTGYLSEPTIEIITKPKKDSDLTYVYNPYSTEVELHEGIVEFIIPEETIIPRSLPERMIPISDDLNMNIIVKVEVNDDLNFKVITDPITGDYFEGKAKGDLVYTQQPDGTMGLNGSLEVVEGKYLFTYQKIIRRPFDVKPGGTISWTGDPFNPQLNIDVEYKVRASTYPLVAVQGANQETGQNSSLKQVFIVKLNIGGTPSKTEISTSLEYPSIDGNINDSEVQTAIGNINQDPSQQNTQAFALILFNGFITPNAGQSDFQVVDFSGNLNTMITQQLNGLANQYIKFVELDFGLDSYENIDNNEQTDFRVSVRKRFLNDRLTISLDGKTTTETGTDESSSQTYLDNVTVEYALTPNGKFKIKIYNKRDFDDFIGGTAVKVGGALVFSKEFNGIKLGKRKKD